MFFCLVLFTKTQRQDDRRNKFYRCAGYTLQTKLYFIIKATSTSCVGIKLVSLISNVVALTFLTLPFPFQQNDTNSLGSRSTVSLKLLIGLAQLAPVVTIYSLRHDRDDHHPCEILSELNCLRKNLGIVLHLDELSHLQAVYMNA